MQTALEILAIIQDTEKKLGDISVRTEPLKFAILTGSAFRDIRKTCEEALPRPQLAEDIHDNFAEEIHCEEIYDEYEPVDLVSYRDME